MNVGLLSGGGFEEVPMMLPGLVREALEAVGVLDDPEGPASLTGEWVALRAWEITVEASLEGFLDERAFVELWGLCGRGRVLIDGEEAAAFSGGSLVFEVTRFIRPDQETLALVLAFEPEMPEGLPQMPAVGIVGGMWLRGVTDLSIDQLLIHPELRGGHLTVTARVEAYHQGEYDFTYALMQGDELICQQHAREALSAGAVTLRHEMQVPSPVLWRAGAENTLYTLRLTVTRQSLGCDRTQQRVGFRTLGTERTAIEDREVLSEINARRIFLRGAVWQRPTWQMRSEEQLAALLDTVRDAHINCLMVRRVETEAFYAACDRRGILVWQELPFDPEEARLCVRQLGYHACIVLWSLPALEVAENTPAPLRHPRVKPIADLLRALEDDRPFLGPVPGGPLSRASLDDLGRGKCFCVLGPDGYQGPEWLARYGNRDDAMLRLCAPSALIPLGRLLELSGGIMPWPPEGPVWNHRGGDVPALDPRDSREWLAQDVTGDPAQMARITRFWQAQTLRYLAQRARSRGAVGFFAGQYNERFATFASGALVEFDGARRPAYFALQSAFAPVVICARLDRTAFWADTNADVFIELMVDEGYDDAQEEVEITATAYSHTGDRIFAARFTEVLRTQALPMQRFQMPGHAGMVLLRLCVARGGETLCREDVMIPVGLRSPESVLAAPPLTLLTLDGGSLLNAGEHLAFAVACDGYEEPWMPGWGALLPGEFHPIRPGTRIEAYNAQMLPGAATDRKGDPQ